MYVMAAPNPPEPPPPILGEQRGDASDAFGETDANALAFTYDEDGSFILPPPVVMQDKCRFSSGLSSTGSTLPPPSYMDGCDR